MNEKTKPLNNILITGASSGIGAALAAHYARPGVRLYLSGRDAARLSDVAAACRTKGANVTEKIIDVTNRANMAEWIMGADDVTPLDLVIANAGISAGMGGVSIENPEQIKKLFDVNVGGVFNTVDPVLPRMIARGQGHIALMSSLAGFRGWPGAPAYCATKAAVRCYGEGLRGALKSSGVAIHVICPGFVKSRMTDANEFKMPFIMPADRAAGIIARGIEKNKGRIAFPLPAYFLVGLVSAMPDSWAQFILSRTPRKGGNG